MDTNKEKWMENVFTSMQGSQRATPNPELLAKINTQFNDEKAIINFWHHCRYASIAAVFILFVNSTALIYYTRCKAKTENITFFNVYKKSLNSTYQIY